MKILGMTASVLALGTGAAIAGGVERSVQSALILFEKGKYAELSFGIAMPDVSGSLGGGALRSGNMAGDYTALSFGYKQALSDNLDIAVVFDQPIGADVDYPATAAYPLRGTNADLSSLAVTGLIKYRFDSNVSVFGGLRAQQVKGTVQIITNPPVTGGTVNYALNTNRDYEFGYVVGVAWERPDIAARVALTYNSAITHSLEATETIAGLGTLNSAFETEVPQSVNLEFQTGIAKDTLLFGSIRWVDWSEFLIDPVNYPFPGALVSYQSDRVTYNLGIGRRFNENWSGAVTVAYEPSNDDVTGNLGPVDGYTSLGLGATYTEGNMEITGGIRYFWIGDATTTIGAQFTDNTQVAAGVKVAFTF
jgi:long-subunit fatty acid transport protein